MKAIVGLLVVLCLICVGCSDDETPPADGGSDAVAEASVDAAPAESGAPEAGTSDAGAETSTADGGPDGAPAEAGSADGSAGDAGGGD